MRVCQVDERAEWLEPLSLTRPTFELLCGMQSLGAQQRTFLKGAEWGLLVRPWLVDSLRLHYPHQPINDPCWMQADDLLLVNGCWLPGRPTSGNFSPGSVGWCQGKWALLYLSREQARHLDWNRWEEQRAEWLETLPGFEVGGWSLEYPWHLVERNGRAIIEHFETVPWERQAFQKPTLVGSARDLWVHPGARVEPMVLADSTNGPVVVDEGAVIGAFTRLEGPCYVGRSTQVLGAKIRAGTTLGPQCRVGGEVEASILHGFTNKYHDGFLGHSYVGAWVNLGAGTHNSDLRNDYGEISVILHGQAISTGLSKVGCFLGDHTKTGLGTLLNTGTHVGAFCQLLPAGRMAPKYIPSFLSWWNGQLQETFSFDQLMTTAQEVLRRRQQRLDDSEAELFRGLFDRTAAERRRVLGEPGQRTRRAA